MTHVHTSNENYLKTQLQNWAQLSTCFKASKLTRTQACIHVCQSCNMHCIYTKHLCHVTLLCCTHCHTLQCNMHMRSEPAHGCIHSAKTLTARQTHEMQQKLTNTAAQPHAGNNTQPVHNQLKQRMLARQKQPLKTATNPLQHRS